MTTILAALIGAALGSVGAQIASERFRRHAARDEARRRVVSRYLLQLQDAVESVISRVLNISRQQGASVMDETYYEVSTLYGLGCLLAQKRRLLLDGAYSQLEDMKPGLGAQLEGLLERFERDLGRDSASGTSFQRYHRLALAEAVLGRDGEGWYVDRYLSFVERYERDDAHLKQALTPATAFINRVPASDWLSLLETLEEIGTLTALHTHIPLSTGGRS
jgi:hypothetical protein